MEVSYVIAGYNEEKRIAESIEACLQMLKSDFDDYELILVNDGSTDNTGEIMAGFAQDNPKIFFLDNIVNLNFGTAVLRGIMSATKEYVVYNAADLCFPLKDTKDVLEKAKNYDVLVLQREDYRTTAWRGVTSKGNRLLLKIIFPNLMKGTPITNYVQVFRSSELKKIKPLARSPIFVWPEMIFRAKLLKLRVGNIKNKVDIKEVRDGSFGHAHDILWGVYEMVRFRFKVWKHEIK